MTTDQDTEYKIGYPPSPKQKLKINESGTKELKEETIEAYAFVEKMVNRADGKMNDYYPYWHGWALREAFEAGFNYCKKTSDE